MSHFPHIFRRQTHAETGSVKERKDKSGIATSGKSKPLPPQRLSPLSTTRGLESHNQEFGVRQPGQSDGAGPSQPPAGSRSPYAASTHSFDPSREGSIYTMAGRSDRTHRGDKASVYTNDDSSMRTHRRDGSASPKSRRSPGSSPSASVNASPHVPDGARVPYPDATDYFPPDQRREEADHQDMYTGLVFGGSDAMGFGPTTVELNDMDGILDPAARIEGHGRQGSAAGANIAPWLQDDAKPPPSSPVDRSGANTPHRSSTNLAHSTSMTSFPARLAMTRTATGLSAKDDSYSFSSRSTSHADIPQTHSPAQNSSSSSRETSQTRHESSESVHTLSAMPQINTKRRQPSEVYNGGRTAAPSRYSRMSLASSTSSVGKEKKGLFGLLKRKGTGVPSDFGPAVGPHRTSMSGSNSSRASGTPTFSESSPTDTGSSRRPSLFSDGMISPLSEVGEFHLDMNLDDMSGIVDPTLANAPPQAPGYAGSNTSSQEARTRQSFATTSSTGGDSAGSTDPRPVREGDASAFSRPNPFANSPTSSIDGRLSFSMTSPPSPQNMSPKHTLAAVATHPAMNQPRRPSQLRNVKLGSWDSDNPSTDGNLSQPLSPTWMTGPSTVFQDPFGGGAPKPPVDALSPNAIDTRLPALRGSDGSELRPVPAIGGAAWAAPESWGVEGDEEEGEAAGEASSSSGEDLEDEEGWVAPAMPGDESRKGSDQSRSAIGSVGSRRSSGQLSGSMSQPPPFGHKSMRGKPGTANRRPRTAQRSDKSRARDRPGTSGSTHGSTVPHWIRIYRADGTFAVMAFQLGTTTNEIISVLSGASDAPAGKKVTTSMKLYLRERGQDRMLQPSERPLLIQDRRLRQAGFTDREHPEEIGKEDLAILVKFIYQTPVLPVMDPEEENQYDSFEFIDIAGRDLQTIPIFLHLHAHNIIILNVSRNPMTDIPLDFIQACTSLKEIRMSNMALKRLPPSIRASTSLARVDVSSNRISDLDSVPLHEISTLLSLKVQNNKLFSIPAYFAQMKALKYLNISNNKFEAFPEVVCEMSNLVDLDVSFNNIASLPASMSNLRSLEKLAVFGNDLSSFPSSFSNLANLRDLDVRRNKLTDLNAVYALPNLTRLQADWNNIVTLDAQLGAKVKAFSVQHNSITRFTLAPVLGATAVTYSLTHLNLSHAKISTLADEAFSGLINLVDLNLNFNQFTQLPSTLGRLTNLEVLSCTDNALNDLPVGWAGMSKLRVLNLHNNNLRQLPAELWLCPIESLNASSNLLQHFDELSDEILAASATSDMLALRKESVVSQSSEPGVSAVPLVIPPAGITLRRLYLADNQINDDVFHHIARMPNLQILNLSFNDIYEVPHGALSHNLMLEALYLSGNKLTSLPSEDLEKLQRLKILHLNGNKLQTLPSELGAIKTLQHLDVGSNVLKYNIANWPYDWNWNWNTALRYLNLSGNKRLEIKPTSGQDMSQASSFRKELSDFTALNQLRILGLMDVTLRIPSLPDESDEKRVRTSFAEVNDMRYGISDMLGTNESLTLFDLVAPNFRGQSNECVFGLFGRSAPSIPSGKIPKFLQESFVGMLQSQLERLKPDEQIADALRRSFLMENRKAFEFLMGSAKDRKQSTASFASVDSMFANWQPSPISAFRTGSSGTIAYLVDRTLYIATIGAHSVVVSRKGEAELMTKVHDPTDREETARIRKAEGWVSPKGLVNEDKELSISRAWGYWQHFPVVNAAPDIRERQLTEADEFVIIASHSLWKCCSYQTAVDIARTERDDPMMAAQKLRDFAISYGAEGSVMVMVVNISDLMYGRGRRANPAGPATGGGVDTETAGDYMQGVARRNVRRRYEEVGDRTLNRLQQEIEPPTGQVAIVFTDIVNSTHLWETNPGMPSSIKIHHNLFRRQLRLDGGYEVKTEGDSFMVSFQTVISALLWCFNCQIMLLQQEWPRELMEANDGKVVYDSEGNIVQRGLRVRMGIHWGNPQCEKDPITRRMDYYGPMVNRAARINASADGGQLMASQDVINELQAIREYVESIDTEDESNADMPPELKREVQELKRIGLEVKEMGERKLKGLEVPEKLHLLYPKVLSGRFEISSNINSTVEVQPTPHLHAPRHIDIEEVRRLAAVCIRLESVASGAVASYTRAAIADVERRTPPGSPNSPSRVIMGSPRQSQSPSVSPTTQHPRSPRSPRIHVSDAEAHARLSLVHSHSMPLGAPLSPVMVPATFRQTSYGGGDEIDSLSGVLSPHSGTRRQNTAPTPNAPLLAHGGFSQDPTQASAVTQAITLPPPALHLGPTIRDDMTDDELLVVIESLISRLENTMSSIYVKQLGGINNILTMVNQALQATPAAQTISMADRMQMSMLGQVLAMLGSVKRGI